MIAKCDKELGIGPCSVCEREERMTRVSRCICKAGHKISCPVHGLKPEFMSIEFKKGMNLFSEGQIVVDIFDETQTEWIVWEQKDKWVMVFIPSGMITIKPAAHLHVIKMD